MAYAPIKSDGELSEVTLTILALFLALAKKHLSKKQVRSIHDRFVLAPKEILYTSQFGGSRASPKPGWEWLLVRVICYLRN